MVGIPDGLAQEGPRGQHRQLLLGLGVVHLHDGDGHIVLDQGGLDTVDDPGEDGLDTLHGDSLGLD